MKVLITGASGFLGGRLAKSLHADGFEVLALSRSTKRQEEFGKLGIRSISGNPYTKEQLDKHLRGIKRVVHCAALSSPWADFADFYDANVVLSKRLLNISIEKGIERFVNISSPSIYFDYTDRLDIKESDPLPTKFVNAYAETKWEAEEYILSKHGQGIECISLRPRAIIGAEDEVLFPRLMRAYDSGRLRIIGDGSNLADFTSVRNLISAITTCLEVNADACGKSYNISNGNPSPIWQEINYLIEGLGKPRIAKKVPYSIAASLAALLEAKARIFGGNEPKLTRYGAGVLAKNFSLDIGLAKNHLAYTPKISTKDALDDFIDWYKSK